MARVHILACLAAILSACFQAPGDELTAASREDPACAAELLAALEAFREQLGLGYEVLEADADRLGDSGTLQKSYTRDAVRFTVEFGLDADDGACELRLWSMTEQRPGSTSTRTGDFGAAALEVCRCS